MIRLRWSVLLFLLLTAAASAQVAREAKDLYPNYDIRDLESAAAAKDLAAIRARAKSAPPAQAVAQTQAAMSGAKAALAARVPSLRLEMNARGTAPEAIGTTSAQQFLTPESTQPRAEIAQGFLLDEAALFGLTTAQVQSLVKTADYTNPAGNMSWVEFRQEANGLPIFQAELRAGFTAEGALARTTGNLAPALDYSRLTTKPVLSPAAAATRAAASIGYTLDPAQIAAHAKTEGERTTTLANGPFTRPIHTEQLYFPIAPGVATLAYATTLWEDVYAYTIIVDANDGTLLWRKNITAHQTQSATYSVYTGDSPSPFSPSNILPGQGTQPAGVSRTTLTLIGNEAPNTFNNLGWITDGGNVTTGNNVNAGVDLSAPNGIDTNGQATGSPTRVFNFNYNPAPGGTDQPSTANSRNGAVTNLFYWANVYHDRLYLLGFTEAAKNFQTNNFSRGGLGNDAVLAEVQDYSGTNNANFSTPADGSAGRMQMYLFTGPTPQRDGALDGEVFLHELTHGLSNRLHNNGSGLTTQQAGGMGEGWSDYYARCLLSSADEDVHGVFASGGYVTYLLSPTFTDNYYYGIRRFPYANISSLGANGKPYDPMTFGDIDLQQINALNNGAFPPSAVIGITANEVHNIGAIWCQMLLEMRARMITRLGWSVGNQRALQIVTDAMKLDVASPTIVQARDTIIAADNAGFAGDDVPDIRSGFAARGAGAGASTTVYSTSYFTIVESYYPSSTAGAITFSDSLGNGNGVAEPGEDLVFTIPLTNRLTSTDNNVIALLGTYSASYGNLTAGATATKTFTYHVPATAVCGTILTVPFVVTSANGSATVNVPLAIGQATNTVLFSENFDSVTAPALPVGWTASSSGSATWKTNTSPVVESGNAAFAADISTVADSSLTSPMIALGAGRSRLSFKHLYTTESPYDGGVLEISIAGGAFTDIQTAGGTFAQGGYGATISSSATGSALIGRRAWSGTLNTTGQVIVDLPAAAASKNVQFRWRFGSDSSTGSTGWSIDAVQVYGVSYGCATIDTDGDGIPDGYEIAHGLDPNNPDDAAADSDGDGVSNLDEYLAGTDPMNANSVLRVSAVTRDGATGAFSFTVPTVNGKVYRIQFNNDLTDPNGWTLLQDNVIGTGTDLTITDPTAAGQPQRFYRAVVIF